MTATRRRSQLLFVVLALCVNIAATQAARAIPSATVRFAAILDMTLTVCGLYFWLVVRPGYRGNLSLAFIFLVGLLRASFAFPGVIPGREFLIAAFEVVLVAGIISAWRSSRAVAEADPVARLRKIFHGYLPSETASRALAAEFSVWYYAFAWKAKPHVAESAKPFTLHQRSGFGDILRFVWLASLLEVLPAHLVVAHWSFTLSWVLTGLSLYGALWAIAIGRSLELRPALVTEQTFHLRFGLLFDLEIPREAIRTISREAIPSATVFPRRAEANIYLQLTHPLRAELIFGLSKTVQVVGICADDPEALLAALTPPAA